MSGIGEGVVERLSQQELTGRLVGHGRMPWKDAVRHLEQLNALWTDLQGLHIEDLGGDVGKRMLDPPFTSHMWCWSPTLDRMLRLRIEGTEVIVSELIVGELRPDNKKDSSESVSIGARKIPLVVSVDRQWVDYCIGLFVIDELHGITFFGIPNRGVALSRHLRTF